MKRDLTTSSITKIYLFLGIVSVAGIFLLFFFPKNSPQIDEARFNRDLINQVLISSRSTINALWFTPSLYVNRQDCHLPANVGDAYLECNPQGWRCLWNKQPSVDIEYAGKKYKLKSTGEIFFVRRTHSGLKNKTGYITEIEFPEFELRTKVFLPKTCHEVYLPERTYAYGEVSDPREMGVIWDNAGRKIFIDKFYVSQSDVQEWKNAIGEKHEVQMPWAPAKLSTQEQIEYCTFHGKQRLMAHFFDASQMTPVDMKVAHPDFIVRPDTPWQRDYNRTFFVKGREEGFRPSNADCELAQVKGCPDTYFMTDSVSWAGVAFGLGFEEEQFFNPIDVDLTVKKSSKFQDANSKWHKLGLRTRASEDESYAFRCFREVL